MARKLATIETITEIEPLENSDNLNVAKVRGWNIVTNKSSNLFKDDRVVFFEIDSALPLSDHRFKFLQERSYKEMPDGSLVHILKTARLRGQYSQGMIIPISEFPEAVGKPVGYDLTEDLNITLYEAPLPAGNSSIIGKFPTNIIRKSDSERAQNLTRYWDTLLENGPWEASLKIDGTSLTVIKDLESNLIVCSRNYRIAQGGNVYYSMVEKYDLAKLLQPGESIQAEIYGPGIQGNPVKVNEQKIAIFNFVKNRVPVARLSWKSWMLENAAPVLDLKLPETVDEALTQVDGLKSILNPSVLAEGVVWHQVYPHLEWRGRDILEGRNNFKVISNKYLSKFDK